MTIKSGNLRGDKFKYDDGIGYCIWYPIDEHEDMGLCFDFPDYDLDDIVTLILQLKEAEAVEVGSND